MPLRAGERLGPYEVLGGLGAGGMGEVYRARDPRLGRTVAIKVLPTSVSADPGRRHRFEHEARATGLLNHPNIIVVYDVGDHEGAPYLVGELLEGETLRQRLQAGTISVRKTADYALQTARGLAAAHDKGIVHRDLKPENLFVTNDGIVKILDFGLARLERVPETEDEVTATMTSGTDPGAVLGTVGYMSPEQVRGEVADHRSDLFALGAVLYEMLTGRRAFHRDTSVETLNAILKDEPPDFPADRQIPPALDRLVRHCLEKKPDDRFQSARDLVFELEGLSGSSVTAGKSGAAGTVQRRRRWLAAALVGLVAVGAIGGGFLSGRWTSPSNALRYHRMTFRRGAAWSARFAPDGQTVIYGAAWEGQPIRLFTARPGTPESRPLELPDADVLAVSRSGELALALDRDRYAHFNYGGGGTLARAPLGGGSPRPLFTSVFGADWSRDGKELAITRRTDAGEWRLEYPVGTVLTKPPIKPISPRISPDGDRVAFLDRGAVHVVDRAGGMRRLSPEPPRWSNSLAWSPRGDEIWFGGALRGDEWSIYAVDLRGRTRVVADLPFVGHLLDVLPDGRALLNLADERTQMIARLPGVGVEKDISWLDWSYAVGLSPDGSRLLFTEVGQGGARTRAVYLRPTDGSAPAVLVAERSGPRLTTSNMSADTKWLLFWDPAQPGELRLVPTGVGTARVIAGVGIEYGSCRHFVLPDDRRVVACGREPGRPWRSWLQDIDGGRPRPIAPEGLLVEAVSPDGTLAAVRETDRLMVYPIAEGEPRALPGPPEPGVLKAWSADGKSLLVQEQDVTGGLAVRILRRGLANGRRELLREIRPPDQAGLVFVDCEVSADERAEVCMEFRRLSSLFLVEGLR